ncbi:SDR family oxidoreductase [Paraburkholderia bryophila]|uniref:NAD(P)-dependent dehydrogenase (Short-subunit alcohol dehydrogenase family) n=1 Tax=Paraburkholderia bryophila TaxID=420952 RepID=A0A7Y9WH30_9BURK|nr:SDR family oxidoreductase [Paraburkholderia bryophila]NYH20101.1 NAD(P)-dependent dehydrogenase (short-subunit alcohol dehydrogenase family) [Paraburkholderia bryophila]
MTTPDMKLRDQRVVLLGGTSGIGLATAHAALAMGASVIVVSSSAQRVADAVSGLGERASGYTVDLSDQSAVRGLFEQLGPFDHLVYSAGDSLQTGPLAEMDLDTVRRVFDVRVFGAIAAVKHATPYLRPGGSVVLTSGVASLRPQRGWVALASACSAMEGLVRALAVELAPVRVNLVSPGLVRTPLWANLPDADREALFAASGEALPVGYVAEADDLAHAYVYLMTNRYATGQTVVVDGGGVLV